MYRQHMIRMLSTLPASNGNRPPINLRRCVDEWEETIQLRIRIVALDHRSALNLAKRNRLLAEFYLP